MKPHCSYTGKPIEHLSDAVWDDGEWISWEYILSLNPDYLPPEDPDEYETADKDYFFESLVSLAEEYYDACGRYLNIWGELGELYAEAKYGLRRHKSYAQGSDGRIGNDLVEVKTISPEKGEPIVAVKRTGNFNVLVVVKIGPDFSFESRWVERKDLGKGVGKFAKYHWKVEPNL
jgi:hypothetical protein